MGTRWGLGGVRLMGAGGVCRSWRIGGIYISIF